MKAILMRVLAAVLVLLALPWSAFAATLWCQVTHNEPFDSVRGAMVRLDRIDPFPYLHYQDSTQGEAWAWAIFNGIVRGTYTVTAMHPGEGFASQVVDVNPDGVTYTTLQLGHGEGAGEWNEMATFVGFTTSDQSGAEPTRYYLKNDVDSTAMYHLVYGPTWYQPSSGAHRPQGQTMAVIEGTLFNYTSPPLLIVRSVDHLSWRPFELGHGGAGGQYQYMAGCTLRTCIRYEETGRVYITGTAVPDSMLYVFRARTDSTALELDFGADTYEPPENISRPADSEEVSIVGGYMPTDPSRRSHVIVYELNGHLWRVPGDTTGFGLIDLSTGDGSPTVVKENGLLSNYPNPFNGTTAVTWTLSQPTRGMLDVVDLLGRRVTLIQQGLWQSGSHSAFWTCDACPTGVYFLRLQTPTDTRIHRMTLVR
jgi:hypothetical protein